MLKNWHTHNQDGHGFDHVFRVYKLAQSILSDYPMADQDIVLAAALLHDTYDEKLVDDVPAAKQQVAAFLTSISFQEQTRVFDIIDNLSFSSQLEGTAKPLTLNGKIVQDADRLDAIGAFGIARTIQYGVSRNRELYDPEIPHKVTRLKQPITLQIQRQSIIFMKSYSRSVAPYIPLKPSSWQSHVIRSCTTL